MTKMFRHSILGILACALLTVGGVVPVLAHYVDSGRANAFQTVPRYASAPAAQAQCTIGPRAVPIRWFEETFTVTTSTRIFAGDDARTKETSEARRILFQVPLNRFAVIESIAVKGTHPQGSYLAIELTTVGWASMSDTTRTFARHFLYSKQLPDPGNSEVHIRESLSGVTAAPTSYVGLGIQLSKDGTAAPEHQPFIVTVTGTLYVCQ